MCSLSRLGSGEAAGEKGRVRQPRVGRKQAEKLLKPRGELDKHLGIQLSPLIHQGDTDAH